jgi:DNA-binding transcriptional ArsR family regulator
MTMSAGRELAHPARSELNLLSVLHALADRHRLTVVRELAAAAPSEVPCGQLELPVGRSTYTYHFRVLREAGVIRQRYQGTSVMNQLRRSDLDAVFPGLMDSVLERAAVELNEPVEPTGSRVTKE